MAAKDIKPLIVIVGETATGKSGLAVKIATGYNGEIISADSWAVYRGFDIGTAKPSLNEQTKVPHYLIDVANPKTGFSAAEFKKQASKTIEEINKRGKLPILVGGTGLYIDSLLFDYKFLPAGPSNERKRLNELSIKELLKEIDARGIGLTGIDLRNKRRLIRLLEANGQRPTREALRPNTLIIGLKMPKEELEKNISKRVDIMLAKGLQQEVKNLAGKYDWQAEPMKGIGYREWRDFFDGKQDLEQTRERIIKSNLQLAKKQRTWFKRNNSIHWVRNQAEAITLLGAFLNK